MIKIKNFFNYNRLVIILFFLVFFSNVIWLNIDTRPPHWDFAIHLSNVLDYFEFLNTKKITDFIIEYRYYPPLSYYITAIFYKFFGINEDIAVLSLTFYLIILFFSLFKIGEFIKNDYLGFLIIISLIGSPFLISQTREYQLDFPLTSMIALNFYLFLKADLFNKTKYSLLFGLTSGLALLTKWTYLIFFIGIVISSFFDKNVFDKKKINLIKLKLKNILFCFFIVFLIAGPWYINNFDKLKLGFKENSLNGIQEKDPSILTVDSLLWYLKSIYYDHLRFPFLILFLIGLFSLFFKNKKMIKVKNYKGIFYILFISFFYLLVMTFHINKDARYIEPLTIVFIILISFWIVNIKRLIFRRIMIFLLIFISFFNFYTCSFGIKFIPETLKLNFFGMEIIWWKQYGYTLGIPKKENWHLKEIIKKIKIPLKKTLFVLKKDKMFFNFFNIYYYKKLYAKDISLNLVIDKNLCYEESSYFYYDYIVVNSDFYNELFLKCYFLNKDFKEIENFSLPDNSELIVFKKN